MPRLSDITSTERLLRAIRTKKDAPSLPGADAGEPKPRKTGHFRLPLPKLISLQKPSTVGIDIGHDYLRLVRAVETSAGHWKVIERRRFTPPQNTPRGTPEFEAFLKSALAAVGGSTGKVNLWVIMSMARVEVRHVRIPRVPRKQIANAVYWMVRKETPFDDKEMIFDFETQGEVIEQGIPKLAVMVYTVPRQEIEDLKGLFSRIGRPLTGISLVPFSVQNLFRTAWIPTEDRTMASLFIGNDFSRIDIYSADNLVMTRGIKAGLSSMVEALVDRYNERNHGLGVPPLTIEQGRKIIRSLSPESPPLEQGDGGFGLGKGEIFEMIQPALERLTRQVERTFEHYITTAPDERIARIYVSGAMNIYRPIVDYVGAQLGVASAVMDPLADQDTTTAACPDVDDAHCISERIAFGPALGLAFSDNNHTPNLMFTYKDKEREASVVRINRAVFAVFILSVLLCSGVFLFQNRAIAQKRAFIASLETQQARLGTVVNREELTRMAARVSKKRQLAKAYVERYLDVALLGELASLASPAIRFTDLKISRGAVVTGAGAAAAPKTNPVEVTLEGLILGDRQMFETELAGYTMALESSPLFRQVIIKKSSIEPYLKDEAFHFILNLKVEEQAHG